MKIKYIVNARIPTEKAHGYQICKMCEEFVLAGIDVELVVPKRKNSINKSCFDFYDIKNNFKVTKIFCFDLVNFGYFGFWIERLSFLISAKIYLFNKKFAKIYTRDELVGLFFKNAILELHNIPNAKKNIYKFLLNKFKKIIVLTTSAKRKISEDFDIEEKGIMVSPDGVDLNKFDIKLSQEKAREKLNLSQDKKIILYSGHLYDWKGAQVLADSAKSLDKNSVVYFVGGTERDVDGFKKKNQELINKGRIVVVGYRNFSEIPKWLKGADVLVLPNSKKEDISSFYTSPLKLFEYMASKRPIIASSLPSFRDVLSENNSVLFKSDDSKDLSKKIKHLLEDDKLKAKISQKAFSDVQDYTWEKRARKILNFIK